MKPGNAKIYASFNALKGLYETLEKQEIYHEEKKISPMTSLNI